MRAATVLAFAFGGALTTLAANESLPTNVIEWVTLLISLLGAYLAWRQKRA